MAIGCQNSYTCCSSGIFSNFVSKKVLATCTMAKGLAECEVLVKELLSKRISCLVLEYQTLNGVFYPPATVYHLFVVCYNTCPNVLFSPFHTACVLPVVCRCYYPYRCVLFRHKPIVSNSPTIPRNVPICIPVSGTDERPRSQALQCF